MDLHDIEMRAADSFLSTTPIIVDVGANFGQSIEAFKTLRPDATVTSFEPNPIFKERLEEIVRQYRNVNFFSVGLGAKTGSLKFFTPCFDGEPAFGNTTTRPEVLDLPHVAAGIAGKGTLTYQEFEAPIATGDSFGLSPDLIKIDVEGAEIDVLHGFASTIETCKPVIVTENSFMAEVDEFLTPRGYVACMADPDRPDRLRKLAFARLNTYYVPEHMTHIIDE